MYCVIFCLFAQNTLLDFTACDCMTRSVPPILSLLKSYLVSGTTASYTIFYDDDTTSLLSPEIYNLFIVATLITLFICTNMLWF